MSNLATPKGSVIKRLRLAHPVFRKQVAFAAELGTDARTIRRIENEDRQTDLFRLKRMAKIFGVALEAIAVTGTPTKAIAQNPDDPEFEHFARMTTAHLEPVNVEWLTKQVSSPGLNSIIPHVLVAQQPEVLRDIEEFLGLLDGMIKRRLYPLVEEPQPELHDTSAFPDISRARRLAELAKRLKADDVRILASEEMWRVPEGHVSPVKLGNYESQVVIAFAPPRQDNEDSGISVPYNQGCDFSLPTRPPL